MSAVDQRAESFESLSFGYEAARLCRITGVGGFTTFDRLGFELRTV